MFQNSIYSFLRKYPLVDGICLFIVFFWMRKKWRKAKHTPEEQDPVKRQAGAKVITNQITGTLTASSIILAIAGAVLAIGFKNLPSQTLDHLLYTAFWTLPSIIFGVYTLGYISSPSVIHVMDVTKKPAVQLACFMQLNMIIVSVARFLLALWHLRV